MKRLKASSIEREAAENLIRATKAWTAIILAHAVGEYFAAAVLAGGGVVGALGELSARIVELVAGLRVVAGLPVRLAVDALAVVVAPEGIAAVEVRVALVHVAGASVGLGEAGAEDSGRCEGELGEHD